MCHPSKNVHFEKNNSTMPRLVFYLIEGMFRKAEKALIYLH